VIGMHFPALCTIEKPLGRFVHRVHLEVRLVWALLFHRKRHARYRRMVAHNMFYQRGGLSGHGPIAIGNQLAAGRVGKANQVPSLGGERLTCGQRQSRVIAGQNPVIE
jgi:hypothetical protein